MKFFYSDVYPLNLPSEHSFPATKYAMLRKTLIEERILSEQYLRPSAIIDAQTLHLAHSADYAASIIDGTIDAKSMRRIGFPWSSHVADRSRATVGGAVAAAHSALEKGISGQLSGGTHHAHRNFGAGYCVFNDFAVAALSLIESNVVDRVAIVDLDVHQGDGNAAILSSHDAVFVFSVHGEKNFPFRKAMSDLDISLPDGVDDSAYLSALSEGLAAVWDFNPDLVLYQAGVDPLAEDRLGRMALSLNGLATRDRLVLSGCHARGIPVSMAIGGGYADPIDISVAAYANTYRVAKSIYGF